MEIYIEPVRMYLRSCPDYLETSTAIRSAWRYRMHWQNGQLQLLFPNGVPVVVIKAIEQIEYGYNSGLHQKFKMREKAGS